jgi:hypothetical protein
MDSLPLSVQNKDVLLNRNNVNGKLKRGVVAIPYLEPGPGFLTSYVVVFSFMRDD